MMAARSEFTLPLSPRDQGWIDLRTRLARAAREIHFSAFSGAELNSGALLVIAGNLAGLAMSIPLEPTQDGSTGFVDKSTPFAGAGDPDGNGPSTNSNSVDEG